MRLPLKQRLKLIRQKIYAAISFRGHRPLKIKDSPLGADILVDGVTIAAPSPLRWKLYKKGWRARLDQLEREYGVGRHIQLDKHSTVLDVGANAGEFAHICARYDARIYCIEPDPRVFACLSRNIASLNNASAHDALLWKEAAALNFFSAPERADSSVFDEGQGPAAVKNAVPADAFAKEAGIERVDLFKCDAEGAEPEVLEGARDILKHVHLAAIDTGAERRGKRTNKECSKLLEDAGLRVLDEKVGKRLMTYGIRP